MKKITRITTLMLLFALLLSTLSGCNIFDLPEQTVVKDKYDVIYDLNYEGGQTKTVQVKANTRATQWKATRSGYTLAGWYTDKECTEKFDFMNYINADITLYALWIKNATKYTLTIDYNYADYGLATVSVEENKTISAGLLPECPILGMYYDKWYTDAEHTQEWDMENDVITGDLTLYPSYVYDPTIVRDGEGNIVFEGIQLNVWLSSDFGTKDTWQKIINNFNYLYNGRIKINLITDLDSAGQENVAIRIQQTPGANTSSNYYDAADLYNLLGYEYSVDDWYGAEECFIDGKLHTIPMYASVPYIIYNKDLMTKYNGENALPSSYTEFKTLLANSFKGERQTNDNYYSIFTNTTWTYKEITSMGSFMQNDANYYEYVDGNYVNNWGEEMTNALIAMQNIYDLFNTNGYVGGLNGGSNEYTDDTAKLMVSSGNALMGVINWAATSVNTSSNIGVMPISGLFADSDKANYQYIPIQTIGIQFYRAKNVNIMQLIAGAVFADYATKNMADMGKTGFYPLNKEVVQSDSFQNSSDSRIQTLLQIGDPEQFHTLQGALTGKSIVNATAAETYIVPFLDEATPERLNYYISMLRDSIIGQLP